MHSLCCPNSCISLSLVNFYWERLANHDVLPRQGVLQEGGCTRGPGGHRHPSEGKTGLDRQPIEISLQLGRDLTKANLSKLDVDRCGEGRIGAGVEEDGLHLPWRGCIVQVNYRRLRFLPFYLCESWDPDRNGVARLKEIIRPDVVGTHFLGRKVAHGATGFGHHDRSQQARVQLNVFRRTRHQLLESFSACSPEESVNIGNLRAG